VLQVIVDANIILLCGKKVTHMASATKPIASTWELILPHWVKHIGKVMEVNID